MNNFYVNGANHISFVDGVVTFHFCSSDIDSEGNKSLSDDFRVSMTINSFNIMMQSCEDFIKKINEIKVENAPATAEQKTETAEKVPTAETTATAEKTEPAKTTRKHKRS